MNKQDKRQQPCLRALAADELLEDEASKLLTQNYPLLAAADSQKHVQDLLKHGLSSPVMRKPRY